MKYLPYLIAFSCFSFVCTAQKKSNEFFYVKKGIGSVTFRVDTVSIADTIFDSHPLKYALAYKLKASGIADGAFNEGFYLDSVVNDSVIEGFNYLDSTNRIILSGGNSFLEALNLAYDNHLPLVISPDMIWLLICKGFSMHVNQHSKDLQKLIVLHKGKKEIVVRRDDFVKGGNNPWNEIFPVFTDSLRNHVKGDLCNLIAANFSTTKENEKIAFELTLMESVASYFNYTTITACGFPEITIEGTPEDWIWIRTNVEKFKKYGLEKWVSSLVPVLDQFVAASQGNVNRPFWRKMYKYTDEYSQRFLNGWIIKFFPYLVNLSAEEKPSRIYMPNPFLVNYRKSDLTIENFSTGISKVDFLWKYYDTNFNMCFYAGFIGVKQDPASKAIKPVIGWSVTERK
jgi:hypothetical protein